MHTHINWSGVIFKRGISYFFFVFLSSSIYASEACRYSDFDLNTLPDNPMQAIHTLKTVEDNLTFMAYSYKDEPAVQLISLNKTTDNYFEILTQRDVRDQKYLALDIIQKTSPKEYLQIRVVGESKPSPESSRTEKTLIRVVNKEKKVDVLNSTLTQIFPHWIKISLICRNGIMSQKERVLGEVYYKKYDKGWTKISHIHIYPRNHPMVQKKD